LIEAGKLEKARVKVEHIINEDIHVELLELLELYCELLLARFGLLEQHTRDPDPGVAEGVCAIIHAAPRTEVKELHVLREMLTHKYGRDFAIAVMENKDNCVSERVTKKITNLMPSRDLVDAYLFEIAKGYGIEWSPYPEKAPGDEPSEDTTPPDEGEGGGGDLKSPLDTPIKEKAANLGDKVPTLPELPPTEDTSPPPSKTNIPSGAGGPSKSDSTAGLPPPYKASKDDEFLALAKRFEALKKR